MMPAAATRKASDMRLPALRSDNQGLKSSKEELEENLDERTKREHCKELSLMHQGAHLRLRGSRLSSSMEVAFSLRRI